MKLSSISISLILTALICLIAPAAWAATYDPATDAAVQQMAEDLWQQVKVGKDAAARRVAELREEMASRPQTRMARGLLAGAAIQDITPPVGVPLGGFGNSRRKLSFPDFSPFNYVVINKPSEGVHDPVTARALVLDTGAERVAFVICDTVGATQYLVDSISSNLSSLNISPDNLLIAGTHNHSGPGALAETPLYWFIAMDFFNQEVFDHVSANIMKALEKAVANLQPAKLGLSMGTAPDMNHNRAHDYKPTSPDLGVIRVDRMDDSPLAVMFTYAAHCYALGPGNLYFTADIMGSANEALERQLPGAVSLFFNSAEGDVSPNASGWTEMKSWGNQMAGYVMDIYRQIVPSASVDMASVSRQVTLPSAHYDVVSCADPAIEDIFPSGLVLDLDSITDREARFQAVRFGDQVIVTIPGEAITEVGEDVKAAILNLGYRDAFVFGLSNGHLAYITSPQEYAHYIYGEYEPCSTIYGPTMADLTVQSCREVASLAQGVVHPLRPQLAGVRMEPAAPLSPVRHRQEVRP